MDETVSTKAYIQVSPAPRMPSGLAHPHSAGEAQSLFLAAALHRFPLTTNPSNPSIHCSAFAPCTLCSTHRADLLALLRLLHQLPAYLRSLSPPPRRSLPDPSQHSSPPPPSASANAAARPGSAAPFPHLPNPRIMTDPPSSAPVCPQQPPQ
jgi:hypothetical protein